MTSQYAFLVAPSSSFLFAPDVGGWESTNNQPCAEPHVPLRPIVPLRVIPNLYFTIRDHPVPGPALCGRSQSNAWFTAQGGMDIMSSRSSRLPDVAKEEQ
jgi:hypothetical protein